MLLNKFVCTVLTAAVCACSTLSIADEKALRIGIEAAYPPFAYKTPDNQLAGFDYDIGQELCTRIATKCEWIEMEFDGLIPALKVRKIDAAISSVSITAARARSVDFTNSYYLLPAKLVARKDSGINVAPADLKGKRIGVQRASNFDRYATEIFEKEGAEVVKYGTQNEVFLDLAAGRLDASLAGALVIEDGFLKTPQGADYHVLDQNFTDETYFGTGAGIAIRKNDPLVGKLNDALAAIKKDGTYDKIQKRHFQYDISGDNTQAFLIYKRLK
ncbi:transporter substrate-binding domain-containing protein [Pseudomonas sp. 22373]|jgi:arginine/ornithine transport system substrate-binding protein|uniref:transporter substrate-binding domain-containing protein n=1 Tax=unclassified Pseudomonas TaxID=196821 RepID=UPI00244A470D|nr:transporter substrate-binding domain-containing protein [Pseudomonas sp. GD03696]EKT4532751.1 transporter substrate-binding domain-containing protein [Pseudomonas putida]MDH1930957.1 transporter substrate-binding domain-containing protein [Pseudomonas sp. GD03696]